MREIAGNVFVGSAADLIYATGPDDNVADGWHIISCARDPWHREELGYSGRGAPRDDPEYLFARRPNRLLCNLVDAADPAFVRDEIVEAVMQDIDAALADSRKVLLHCNEGKSRAPTLGLLWLRRRDPVYQELTFSEGVELFRTAYPDYAPAGGMEGYARAHWG